MKKLYIYSLTLIAFVAISCKSAKVVSDGTINSNQTAKSVIRNHYANELNFKTITGRMRIDYTQGESSQGTSVSLRMEKDKAIWLSAPLGMGKAYITPVRVSFYNKLQNEYFDGDFTYLSNLLGIELDFNKVQNLLLGQAILDLRQEKYDLEILDNAYVLQPKKVQELFQILFKLEPKNFKMESVLLSQPWEERLLKVTYQNYQKVGPAVLPNDIRILAVDKDSETTIDIEYKNMELNKSLNFPYKIPNGFKEIVLE